MNFQLDDRRWSFQLEYIIKNTQRKLEISAKYIDSFDLEV